MRVAIYTLVLMLLSLAVLPVMAQVRPDFTIITTWRPGEELVSDPGNGDIRTVELEITVNGNVEFWAMNLSCNIGRGTELIPFEDADQMGPFTWWGNAWFDDGEAAFYPDDNFAGYADSRGTVELTATRVGNNTQPIGQNGVPTLTHLVTLNFKVADDTVITRNTNVRANCRVAEFLDRDGNVITRARQARGDNLNIISGYTITGQVLNQATRDHAGIDVTCVFQPTSPQEQTYTTTTDRNGFFTIGGPSSPHTVRDRGYYSCTYANQLPTTNDVLLQLKSDFQMWAESYNILPFILPAGDVERTNTPNQINIDDIGTVTSATWDQRQNNPYTNGDANGDAIINEADLAIVAANNGFGDDGDPWWTSHTLYGLATDYESVSPPNSKIRLGSPDAGATTEIGRSRNFDFWPALAPDGKSIAHISVNPRTGVPELVITDATTGRSTSLTGRIRNFPFYPFAPSWSPDGQQIAFACSTPADYPYNRASVCVLNADDTNGTSLRVVDEHSKIYPPSWYNSDALLYAGDSMHPVCPDGICFNHMDGAGIHELYSVTDFVVDMPSYQRGYGGTPPPDPTDNFKFVARLNTTNGLTGLREVDVTIQWGDPFGITFNDATTIPRTQDVDFYNLANDTGLRIMFYTRSHPTMFQNIYADYDPQQDIEFWPDRDTGIHFVDGFWGNPAWNGDPMSATDLHAYRATFDWVQ